MLRETRALRGFTRVRDDALKLNAGKALLRRESLPPAQDWLPAYVVKGEGIYLEFERRSAGRVGIARRGTGTRRQAHRPLRSRGQAVRGCSRALSPRFVLIHTLGHLLINELIFTCGYSSASLRERLYVSDTPGREMAGLLIYTAAGDSEGTMGGLVRMARTGQPPPGHRRRAQRRPLVLHRPGLHGRGEKGQGPDSCNLAACHGCALLPETSCEEFNRFLDRGLVIGTLKDPSLGFFSP